MHPPSEFVGRADPAATLLSWLRDEPKSGQLAIGSISGAGGVGKSSLLEHVLRTADLRDRKFLTLRLQGMSGSRTLAELITRDLVDSGHEVSTRRDNVFGTTRNARRALADLELSARAKLEKEFKTDPEFVKTLASMYQLGVNLLELVPHTQAKIAARIGKKLDPVVVATAIKRIKDADIFKAEGRRFLSLPNVLQPGRVLRNALRSSLERVLSDSLLTDLSTILSTYQDKDRSKLLPGKIAGLDNLLLIIDDYESLAETMGGFLLKHFVPALTKAGFKTFILFLGRDRLVHTDPARLQHFEKYLVGDIALTSFTAEEASEYVKSRGIQADADVQRIVADTAGFPYLLHAEVDAELTGASTALGLKMFFDRTTLGMDDEQQSWLRALSFLNRIDREAIQAVLPSADADAVLQWFKDASSIRDPKATNWLVLPIIRSRVQAYVRNDSEREFARLQGVAASLS